MRKTALILAIVGGACALAEASTIDTKALEEPWKKQWVRTLEVDKYEVRWRQRVSKTEGILAGMDFVAPSDLQTTWKLATDYTDLGQLTPGVSSVKFLRNEPTYQLIQVDVAVLWKTLQLIFEVEQEVPEVVRFRLMNPELGEYLGVFRLSPLPLQTQPAPGQGKTAVSLATQLKLRGRVPTALVLVLERMVLLSGVRNFLKTCEQQPLE